MRDVVKCPTQEHVPTSPPDPPGIPSSDQMLKFVASSDVFEFLKLADIHAGLWGTQLFDLFWLLDNLFNVHGGVRFLFMLAPRIGSF